MFMSLIRERRSIRRYEKRAIEAEKIDLLIEAALRPPSSKGIYPWEFIFVTDSALLEKLSESKPRGSAPIKEAPLGVVVCADGEKADAWIEDGSIAATFIQLAAQSMGLASCWIQIRMREHSESQSAEAYIQQLLKIPSSLKVLAVITVGYPAEEKTPHGRDTLKYERISRNYYGQR